VTGAEDLRAALLATLAHQIALGADEAICDRPVDRMPDRPGDRRPAARAASAQAQPPAAPQEPDRDGDVAPDAGPEPEAPSAETAAAGAATIGALGQAIADWRGSGLRETATRMVLADGLPGAPLMVIGEAPGAEEDRQGRPFVGRAGQLLDRMLAAIGLSRSAEDPARAVYIANILPWRPPGNRTPSEAEVLAFLPFVERHVALAGPRVILAVGNTPVRALTGTTAGIRRIRGRWMVHGASGLPVMPSFHPAYLLRQPAEKAGAWAALLAVRAALDQGRD